MEDASPADEVAVGDAAVIACTKQTSDQTPILMLEKDVVAHPDLGELTQTLFRNCKNEGGASRGIKHIAPNLFIGSEQRGYFNYSRYRNTLLVYAYTGPEDNFPVIAAELLAHCERKGYQLNILSHKQLSSIGGIAFSATPFGVVQRIRDLGNFTLEGGAMRRLRYQVAAFEKAGVCRVDEYGCGTDPRVDQDIARVIDAWCSGKTKVNPLVHTARAEILAGNMHPRHRLFLTRVDDVLQNVVLISPLSDSDNGYLMDLEFYGPDMPRGGLEFAIVRIIESLVAEGRSMLSLGGTYGCRVEQSSNADTEVDKILDDLHKQEIFNDQGNFQFKNKFRPQVRTIFLCRKAGCGDPDSVIDIIMMIADPTRMQTPDTENHTVFPPSASLSAPTANGAASDAMPELHDPVADSVAEKKKYGRDGSTAAPGPCVAPTGGRTQILADAWFNPLLVPHADVDFDLKTDSWAQLKLPVIAARMQHLRSRMQAPVDVDASLRKLFPFAHFVLTESGRTAEQALYRAWPSKGTVVQNVLFPTNLFHQIDNDFEPKELPCAAFFRLESDDYTKGDLAWEALEQVLANDPRAIAMVCIEVGNNAAGGCPVSIRHLQQIKALLGRHAIPLVLDATRVLENARFLIEREPEHAGKHMWDVAREILACADVVVGSLAKDFGVPLGGIVATNDAALFRATRAVVEMAGSDLDAFDRKLVALALRERSRLEGLVSERMAAVRAIWHALKERGVPVAHPVGGHCVLIDVKRLPAFEHVATPVASFLAWLYLNTGIRAAGHSVGMQRRSETAHLARLAIPLGLSPAQVAEIVRRLGVAFDRMVNIPELGVAKNERGSFGDMNARFTLMQYQRVCDAVAAAPQEMTVLPSPSVQPPAAVLDDSISVDPTAGSEDGAMDLAENSNYSAQPSGAPLANDKRAARRTRDIAIVGMAARYPKAKNLAELWENLKQGRDCIEELPADRYAQRLRYGPAAKYRGGFIEDVDKFDSAFFNIAPRNAERLDPQERLFIEVSWEALEDAGYYPELLIREDSSQSVGVYVGAVWAMYQVLGVEEKHLGGAQVPNSFLWSIANRVSYWMNFSGPSLTIDTACSSSLTALYLACEAIYAGECTSAIVGGVNLDLHQSKWDINWSGGALSKDGVCRSFGQGANGYVAGEGVGAVYIKPLEQAIADGDHVYGVIKSVVVNHGGRTSGFVVPNPKAQTNLIRAALERADVDAASIGYIEAHGTGTELGDPLEIAALNNAFRGQQIDKQSCAIGSLKSNIGHLEAAAGVASLNKVLLQMKHRQLVPSLHSAVLNEHIDFLNSPFRVQQQLEEWKAGERDGVLLPLRAGISSFGAGGSNAHVILESYAAEPSTAIGADRDAHIFPLSARHEAQLTEVVLRLRTHLEAAQAAQDAAAPPSLRDIAFTLQMGRKAFEHRVAVIARTTQQLIDRLKCFLDGKRHDGVIVGNGKNADAIVKLMSRSERDEVVGVLSRRHDPGKLARLWADGVLADWRGAKGSSGGRRVSLPTYPFADKRHWATVPNAGLEAASRRGIHPLIDSNESTFERQLFKKSFHERDFFIYDHLVMDVPTLPGVAYLELARKAGELAAGRAVRRLKNILWVSPIAVRGSATTEAWVELRPANDAVQFEVFSEGENGKRLLHSQGKLQYATEREAQAPAEYVDLAAIRARCEKVLDGKDAYPMFKSFGLNLGPSFQSLHEVYRSDRETLGQLRLPSARLDDLHSLLLHPSLVDGALQAGVAATLGSNSREMVVPFSIGEVEVLHPLQATCWTYVTEVKDDRVENSRVSKKNVLILDDDGRILVRITEATGVPIGEVHKTPSRGKDGAAFAKLYYAPQWEATPLDPAIVAAPGDTDPVLLFDTDGALRDLYRQALRASGREHAIILVRPADCFREVDADTYEIDPRSPEDCVRLIESLTASQCMFRRICFAWPLHRPAAESVDGALQEALQRGVYALLNLCQALVNLKLDRKLRLLCVYATRPDLHQPHHEAIAGFFRALHLEYPKLQCRALEVQQDTAALAPIVAAILDEYQADAGDGVAVRYLRGQRQARKLKSFELKRGDGEAPAALKQGGIYLITGGAGGLGMIFAEHLASKYQARLILTGRSKLSAALEPKLAALRALGAEVLYVDADVSVRSDVERMLEQGRQRFGEIHGVLHSAGVLRDSFVRNKTRAEFDAVLAPKIFGTLHLDELTAREPLDFFALFSSMAAVGGNAGQSDYAFANHYMDSFAFQRERQRNAGTRRGKTLSLNWSLWADGGMKVDEQTELLFTRTLGLKLLGTQTGIEAFVEGLASDAIQLAVLEGNQEKIELAWGLRKKPVAPGPTAASAATGAQGSKAQELAPLVQDEITRMAMEFLKLEADDISADSVLLDLGFDSIGLTTFANEINGRYGVDITPVLFFDYPSIKEVARYLSSERSADVARVHRAGAPGGAAGGTAAATQAAESALDTGATVRFNKGWDARALDSQQVRATARPHPAGRFSEEPIAIVGMSGVMPQSENLRQFWDNLSNARDLVSVIPRDRWNWEEFYGDPFKEENKSNSKWGGFMKDVDKFDSLFFGISRREAQMMDPQQRIFLETVWKAIEDSGHRVSDLSGTRTGLFVGVATNDYIDVMKRLNTSLDGYSASGNSHSVLANRISFLLNLRGPSAPIDTACSSSLVALHRAIESIHTGSSDMAIVGGVQVMLSPAAYISFGKAGMLSGDGKCKSFDKRANGYVRGEGAGAILLKKLSAAEADGDHIYAVIRGTAENHGGRVTTLTAPNSAAQAELLVEAYEKAQIDPATVGYIECHGTGTGIGDPIEIQGLTKAFGELYRRHDRKMPAEPHCGLSSVKTNIGHLETAAGIAGILKALLAIQHRQIPANIHFEELNPYINLTGTPFYVADKTRTWDAPVAKDGAILPRRAGVSSFGFGGANAHIVLEEYIPPQRAAGSGDAGPQLIVLSAKTDEQLHAYAHEMLACIEAEAIDLIDFAYTLQVGRDDMTERLALVIDSVDELRSKLRRFLDGNAAAGVHRNKVRTSKKGGATLSADEAVATVNTLIEIRDFNKLAELWAGGLDVDWQRMPRARAPHRLSLPTYPFARERCWIPGVEPVEGEQASTGRAEASAHSAAKSSAEYAPRATPAVHAGDDASTGVLTAVPKWQPRAVEAKATANPSVWAERHVVLCELPGVNATQLESLVAGSRCAALPATIGRSLAQCYGDHALECFERIQAVFRSKPAGAVLMQVVVGDAPEHTVFAGLAALMKTAKLENPQFCGQVIVTRPDIAPAALAQQLQQAQANAVDTLVRCDDTEQSVLRWQVQPGAAAVAAPAFKENGVYLISGGLGGLGVLFATEILQQTRHARVILTGRGTLGGEKQQRFDGLSASAAGRLLYRTVDLDDLAQVKQLVLQIQQDYDGLHGIIHSAGMTADNYILRKTADEFRAVLAPKVTGTLHLDEASRQLDLDFFVMFSSISGALGNIGQSDYATANAFLDQFALYRNHLVRAGERRGRTLSINWPLWKEGGMRLPAALQQHVEQATGMQPLATANGLQAFYQSLALGHERSLVMEGVLAKLQRTLQYAPAPSAKQGAPVGERSVASRSVGKADELARLVVSDLKRMVAEVLLLDADRIAHDVNLSEYGLDSINVANLFRTMNATFSLNVAPAVVFEYSTFDALSGFLLETHAADLHTHYGDALAAAATALPAGPSASAAPTSIDATQATERSEEPGGARGSFDHPIAIVGIGGVFPGADTPDAFWRCLLAGRDQVSEVPAERWNWRDYDGDEGKANPARWGGFIRDVDKFDAAFFGISPLEAALMDPQQRLFLQTAWNAIEDAGHRPSDLAGTKTGVFVGMGGFDYVGLVRDAQVNTIGYSATGMAHCVLPNRVSYLLDLHGPSEAIDTACSSSLVAIHNAAQAIARGACTMAIAGGVNVLLTPSLHVALGSAGMLAPDGRCKTFDKRADGYVRGEGCAAVLLKRLDLAIADGDAIYGIVKGSGVNHGGRAMSLTAPNPNAQAELLIDTYTRAQIDPACVGLIEAHGTGTAMGDAVEINGLKKAFRELSQRFTTGTCALLPSSCAIGSVKSNVGHLEAASGVVSLIKVLLAIRHRKIPGTLHFEELSPQIRLDDSPFYIAKTAEDWNPRQDATGADQSRTAGVSSLGFGGVNAHLIVQEYVPAAEASHAASGSVGTLARLIPLSAKSPSQLDQRARDLLAHLREHAHVELASVAYTLQVGRDGMGERLGLMVNSVAELVDMLQAFTAGEPDVSRCYRSRADRDPDHVAFINRDADLRQMIARKWLADNEPGRLLELWVKGVDLDWSALYDAARPARVNLPAYPFARERHWIDTVAAALAQASGERLAQRIEQPAASSAVAASRTRADAGQSAEEMVKHIITSELVEQLQVPADQLATDRNLLELGVTSLGIASLVRHINKVLDLNLSPSVIFEYPTIARFAGYLGETYTDVIDLATQSAVERGHTQLRAGAVASDGGGALSRDATAPWGAAGHADAAPPALRSASEVLDSVVWREGATDQEYERLTF